MRKRDKNDKIIENIDATMSMENISLTSDDKELLRDCLEGKVSYEDAVNCIIKQYISD